MRNCKINHLDDAIYSRTRPKKEIPYFYFSFLNLIVYIHEDLNKNEANQIVNEIYPVLNKFINIREDLPYDLPPKMFPSLNNKP